MRIDVDGTETTVRPARGYFTLDEIYEHVGCETVEAVGLADGRTLWLDEEGKFGPTGPKARNDKATRLLVAAGGMAGDYIAGHALVTDATESD